MHSPSATSPTGGAEARRVVTQPALHDNLMERMMDPANMRRAWKRVKANKGAPGSDGMTLEDFPTFARSHWSAVRQALLDGTYQPQPVRRVSIPKPKGGERWLGIPSVVDRVIQQAIGQVLTPIFDPGSSESSFGFRPGRSAHGAVRQVQRTIGEGYRFAVDLDLEKFFDRVNHDVLMARVARKVRDKGLLGLIGRYLRAGVLVGDIIQATELGTPQGGPLSPLLANILLDDLDKELERRGYRFARYADDLLILVKRPRTGERVKASVTRYLIRELKLAVTLSPGAKGVNRRLPEGAAPGRVRNNEQKSRVVKTNDCEFLGFTFRGTKLRWSDQAFADFKHNVRKLTGRSWGVSMGYRLDRLVRYVRGWMTNRQESRFAHPKVPAGRGTRTSRVNYFGISDYYRPIPEIDSWIRRRIRMCYWKQWR